MEAFIHGFILALGLILPLGAQNMFVFQQGALRRFRWALPAVITAAACDTVLILASVGGVASVIGDSAELRRLLLAGGIIFLIYMGWTSWRSSTAAVSTAGTGLSGRRQVFYAMSVSLLNPYAFLDILVVIGGSSAQYAADERQLFMLACIMVSWLWFCLLGLTGQLAAAAGFLQGRGQQWLNKISALVIWAAAGNLIECLL